MDRRHVVGTVTMAALAIATLSADIRFTSMWKSIDAGTVTFAGKKVAALVISNDDSLRMAAEESLVRELSARGLQAVATYRIAPKEELQKPETAKVWLERAAVEGVVAMRPVYVESGRRYTPPQWVDASYSTLWGYYGYGWGSVYIPGFSRVETDVVVETTIYSVPRNALLWAATTQTTTDRDLPGFIEELVKRSVEVLHEQGLAKRVVK